MADGVRGFTAFASDFALLVFVHAGKAEAIVATAIAAVLSTILIFVALTTSFGMLLQVAAPGVF